MTLHSGQSLLLGTTLRSSLNSNSGLVSLSTYPGFDLTPTIKEMKSLILMRSVESMKYQTFKTI